MCSLRTKGQWKRFQVSERGPGGLFWPRRWSSGVFWGEQDWNSDVPCLSQVYMYQLFRSLAYIHSQGVCHRDIKPQNLLVDPDTAVLKLCDFGRWA